MKTENVIDLITRLNNKVSFVKVMVHYNRLIKNNKK